MTELLSFADAPFVLRLLNEPSFIQNIGDRGEPMVGRGDDDELIVEQRLVPDSPVGHALVDQREIQGALAQRRDRRRGMLCVDTEVHVFPPLAECAQYRRQPVVRSAALRRDPYCPACRLELAVHHLAFEGIDLGENISSRLRELLTAAGVSTSSNEQG